jgi:hypothetical protein
LPSGLPTGGGFVADHLVMPPSSGACYSPASWRQPNARCRVCSDHSHRYDRASCWAGADPHQTENCESRAGQASGNRLEPRGLRSTSSLGVPVECSGRASRGRFGIQAIGLACWSRDRALDFSPARYALARIRNEGNRNSLFCPIASFRQLFCARRHTNSGRATSCADRGWAAARSR